VKTCKQLNKNALCSYLSLITTVLSLLLPLPCSVTVMPNVHQGADPTIHTILVLCVLTYTYILATLEEPGTYLNVYESTQQHLPPISLLFRSTEIRLYTPCICDTSNVNTTSFLQLPTKSRLCLLLCFVLAGDVEGNPGKRAPKYPCGHVEL
jgi:hypothetical protein